MLKDLLKQSLTGCVTDNPNNPLFQTRRSDGTEFILVQVQVVQRGRGPPLAASHCHQMLRPLPETTDACHVARQTPVDLARFTLDLDLHLVIIVPLVRTKGIVTYNCRRISCGQDKKGRGR